jgi:hypothetical protein
MFSCLEFQVQLDRQINILGSGGAFSDTQFWEEIRRSLDEVQLMKERRAAESRLTLTGSRCSDSASVYVKMRIDRFYIDLRIGAVGPFFIQSG